MCLHLFILGLWALINIEVKYSDTTFSGNGHFVKDVNFYLIKNNSCTIIKSDTTFNHFSCFTQVHHITGKFEQ